MASREAASERLVTADFRGRFPYLVAIVAMTGGDAFTSCVLLAS